MSFFRRFFGLDEPEELGKFVNPPPMVDWKPFPIRKEPNLEHLIAYHRTTTEQLRYLLEHRQLAASKESHTRLRMIEEKLDKIFKLEDTPDDDS